MTGFEDEPMASQSIEDYIKAIFQIGKGEPVQTSSLAERLDVRPASVSNMMRRLASLGLIEYAPYRGARLTADGEQLARRMVRRHRLIERFLSEVLDFPWDEVHAEAERLEHAVSPRFIEAIDRLLERPLTDPHGAPIPRADGSMHETQFPSLLEIQSPATVTVRRVRDGDAELLRRFAEIGVRPGTTIEVLASSGAGAAVQLRVGGRLHELEPPAAAGVYVEPEAVN